MKNILVIYYTQTGQMKTILDNLLLQIKDKTVVDFFQIQPENDFPFPWTPNSFFDAMPESVLQIPSPLKNMAAIKDKDYDLIIFGYQPWFLSPSIPSNSFLKSEWASVLNGKPVITVLGCRNMWLRAQELVKQDLINLNAKLVGLIALVDTHPNLVSLKTTLRWFFKGQKAADDKLPEAGVSKADIDRTQAFGPIILQHLQDNNLNNLQQALLQKNAVAIEPALTLLEGRGASQFPKWARRAITEQGEERKKVLKKFQRILILSIFVLSPISNFVAKIITSIRKAATQKKIDYFKNVTFKEGML